MSGKNVRGTASQESRLDPPADRSPGSIPPRGGGRDKSEKRPGEIRRRANLRRIIHAVPPKSRAPPESRPRRGEKTKARPRRIEQTARRGRGQIGDGSVPSRALSCAARRPRPSITRGLSPPAQCNFHVAIGPPPPARPALIWSRFRGAFRRAKPKTREHRSQLPGGPRAPAARPIFPARPVRRAASRERRTLTRIPLAADLLPPERVTGCAAARYARPAPAQMLHARAYRRRSAPRRNSSWARG